MLVHPYFFVILDVEIAVDQIRARDRNFEGFPDSGCQPVPVGQPRPYLSDFAEEVRASRV